MFTVKVPVSVALDVIRLMSQVTPVTGGFNVVGSAFASEGTSHNEATTGWTNVSPCFSSVGKEVNLNASGRLSTLGKANVAGATADP